jgi:transposase InsO family protein
MSSTFAGLRDAGVPTRRACVLVGRSPCHALPARPPAAPRPGASPGNAQALSAAERESVLAMISTPAYADLSIGQIWARELDADNYLCSASSMYRIARAAGQTRERRQATHPAKVKPELLADGPSHVWTWDITKLRGPAKGIFYQLYVLIDIPPVQPVLDHLPVEDSRLATDFIAEAIERDGTAPHIVHADRGTSMASKPVSALLADLCVTRRNPAPTSAMTTRTQKRNLRARS